MRAQIEKYLKSSSIIFENSSFYRGGLFEYKSSNPTNLELEF